jgi:haloalkane dehalogenase
MVMEKLSFQSSEYNFKHNHLDINGTNLHYIDEGEGFPTIMLHGNPTWSFFYRNLVTALKGTFRCIVPDHIGCGLSDKPQQYNYTLDTHINNIEKLIDHLKIEKFNLVLHDWGGAIGMGVATRHPDRINSVIIMNSAAFTDTNIPFRIAICKTKLLGEFMIRKFNLFAGAASFMATSQPLGLKGEIKKGFLFPYNNYKNRIATYRFVKDIPIRASHVSYSVLKDIENKLDLLNKKNFLFLWGEKDFCFTTHFLKRWKAYFPNASSYVLPKAGHYVLEDEKEKSINIIEGFLKK